jgi:hypothetical protein
MIVIPYINTGSDVELRYCLRGVELHHQNIPVCIVGNPPTGLRNVFTLPANDSPLMEHKARNIYRKLKAVFDAGVESILYMNDDHFIQAPVAYLHHKGPMSIEGRPVNGTYTALLRNTLEQFPGCNDYDTHCPMWMHRSAFARLESLDWNKPHGFGIKTSYCVLNRLTGEYHPDHKFRDVIGETKGLPYFSTGDYCDLSKLREIFPFPSKYEI